MGERLQLPGVSSCCRIKQSTRNVSARFSRRGARACRCTQTTIGVVLARRPDWLMLQPSALGVVRGERGLQGCVCPRGVWILHAGRSLPARRFGAGPPSGVVAHGFFVSRRGGGSGRACFAGAGVAGRVGSGQARAYGGSERAVAAPARSSFGFGFKLADAGVCSGVQYYIVTVCSCQRHSGSVLARACVACGGGLEISAIFGRRARCSQVSVWRI